jgi:two-component system, NarL family, sensor histidine kinase DesK
VTAAFPVAGATAAAPVSPWERWAWVFAGVWLVFLVYPVLETFQATDSVPVTVLGLVLIASFGVVYMLGFGPLSGRPWLAFGLLIALALASSTIIGVEAIGLTPYLGVFSALMVPSPWWPRTTVVVALLPLLSLAAGGGFPAFFFLMVWPIIIGMVLLRVFTEGERRVDESRAMLALVAERERVARDVHDVLGHSLTALSIKAELAGRLIDVDPARAREELASIQETARQALAEVRATVGGLRAGNLEAELDAAPRVLADVGVEAVVRGDVADTDPRHRVLLAWVLREAVTNVVRHAGASRVVVELGPGGMSVTDDGAGISRPEGNGLRGMRERVADAGGTLSVLDAGPGTRLRVELP